MFLIGKLSSHGEVPSRGKRGCRSERPEDRGVTHSKTSDDRQFLKLTRQRGEVHEELKTEYLERVLEKRKCRRTGRRSVRTASNERYERHISYLNLIETRFQEKGADVSTSRAESVGVGWGGKPCDRRNVQ